ncbi:2OG-Fe dioxygenase family protein [Lysobacter koreensis]|uniref:2OG-Fe dioxygenase family protein n=1 Tax=Lysobacter koreensis TaxID=266122 RepID=A0ABW2YRK6_9GAMM
MSAETVPVETLAARVRAQGFAFVTADTMRALLQRGRGLDGWDRFAASWDTLAPDTYLAALGRHRRRRHAVFSAAASGAIVREPHQPHYQALHYNRLQGDIERWFEPMLDEIADNPSLRLILEFCRDFFAVLAPAVVAWHIELHQFRIEARTDEPGEPTPEGVHRDGVDYVLVLLINRHNIASGTTTIHASDGRELGHFTLTAPLDAALVDDGRVFHGVTAVTPLDPSQPAHRDVLVVTFRACESA